MRHLATEVQGEAEKGGEVRRFGLKLMRIGCALRLHRWGSWQERTARPDLWPEAWRVCACGARQEARAMSYSIRWRGPASARSIRCG